MPESSKKQYKSFLLSNFLFSNKLLRDKLQSNFEEMEFNTNAKANAMEKMQEEKMIRALDYNVKLGNLQKPLIDWQQWSWNEKPFLGNKEEQKTRKR